MRDRYISVTIQIHICHDQVWLLNGQLWGKSLVVKLKWIGLLLVGIMVVYGLGWVIIHRTHRANLYTLGQRAAEVGHWPEAFAHFYALAELDPDYQDVGQRLAEAATQTLDQYPEGVASAVEHDLLRWLAASDRPVALAELLDRCTVNIPASEFIMGSDTGHDDEQPEKQIYLDAFEIDRYEVTNVQYQQFLSESGEPAPQYWPGDEYPAGQADYPVVGVSWHQAQAYCEGVGKRLPTEAEWEKACRGTEGRVYPWGDAWNPRRANVGHSTVQNWPLRLDDGWALLQPTAANADAPGLQPVGSYPAGQSDEGVQDLAGNASEWVADWYNWTGYWHLPSRNPISTGPPWNHSVRGSAWFDRRGNEDLIPDLSRCAARNSSHSYDDPRVGFRCARSLP
jgi:formylglycine-generating enzyme required for sulfatase activity